MFRLQMELKVKTAYFYVFIIQLCSQGSLPFLYSDGCRPSEIEKNVTNSGNMNYSFRYLHKTYIIPSDISRQQKGRRNGNKYNVTDSEGTAMKLDHSCIVKHGYLVKSPPLDKIKSRVARWHMRWFVLHDTKPRCDADPAIEWEVELLYYRNHDSQYNGDIPLGRINMMGAEVSVNRAGIHGYPFVINVEVMTRTYYLCATQFFVFNEWLQKLKLHLPANSLFRPSIPCQPEVTKKSHATVNIQYSTGSIIRRKECSKCRKINAAEDKGKQKTAPTSPALATPPFNYHTTFFDPCVPLQRPSNDKCQDGCTDCQLDDSEDDCLSHTLPSKSFRDEYIKSQPLLKPTLSIMPTHLISIRADPAFDGNESDESDEGIVRTSSESSTTSTTTTKNVSQQTQPSSIDNHIQPSSSMSSFALFKNQNDWNGMGFVGPTLPNTQSVSVMRSRRNDADNNNNESSRFIKKPILRVKSRSLDSLNMNFTELEISTLFERPLDEVFPRLCGFQSNGDGTDLKEQRSLAKGH